MKKETVLWIGEGMQCSLKDGMSWHSDIPGYKLSDLLGEKFDLIKGSAQQWTLEAGILYFQGKELTQKFLSERVLGAIFYHKNLSEEKLKHLQKIFFYLQNNSSNIRLLNSPIESKLFNSKIEFSKHVFQLPNAKSLLPEWKSLETVEDLNQAIDTIGYPFLIKPDSLSGGKGIVKIENKSKALKILRDSRNGIYHKNNLTKLKQLAKNLVSKETQPKTENPPIKLLVNKFIDTYHNEYKCYINANIYYWMGELFYADARVSHKGFNIHAGDSSNEILSLEQYSKIISHVLRLIKRDSYKIKEMIDSLDQHSIRVDCLINLERDLLKVAEVEIKGGIGESSRNKIIPAMNHAGWNGIQIRDYLGGKPCQINSLFH